MQYFFAAWHPKPMVDVTLKVVMIDVVMNNVVAFAQALADETRWRIVRLIQHEPMCVCELADILDMPQSSVSSHVQIIKRAGMLESERCEKWIYYRVAGNYGGLLRRLAEFFELSTVGDAVLRNDARKAAKRLSERDGSCCPLPVALTRLNPPIKKRESKAKTK
jgi:ArsR family transcriptional regulator